MEEEAKKVTGNFPVIYDSLISSTLPGEGGAGYRPADVRKTVEDLADEQYDTEAGWSPGTYRYLKSAYSPEQIEKLRSNRFSNDGSVFFDILNEYRQKPEPIDEKRLNRNKAIAGIADSLGMLSQLWGASRGAYTPLMDANRSASAQMLAREERDRLRYEQKAKDYENAVVAARGQDFAYNKNNWDRDRSQYLAMIEKKRAEQAAKEHLDKQMEQNLYKMQLDALNKAEEREQNDRHHKEKDATKRYAAYLNYIKPTRSNNNYFGFGNSSIQEATLARRMYDALVTGEDDWEDEGLRKLIPPRWKTKYGFPGTAEMVEWIEANRGRIPATSMSNLTPLLDEYSLLTQGGSAPKQPTQRNAPKKGKGDPFR